VVRLRAVTVPAVVSAAPGFECRRPV